MRAEYIALYKQYAPLWEKEETERTARWNRFLEEATFTSQDADSGCAHSTLQSVQVLSNPTFFCLLQGCSCPALNARKYLPLLLRACLLARLHACMHACILMADVSMLLLPGIARSSVICTRLRLHCVHCWLQL